mgnify:FL=1
MKKQLVYLIALLLLQTSCDRVFTMSGHVIDELGNPINNAKIVTSEKETLYSDSLGYFMLNLYGPGSYSDKLEVLVTKKGYETKYFDLSQQKDIHDLSLRMKTSNRELIPSYPKSTVRLFYLINLIITNLFIISTLFFILYKKIKYKWIWMLLILVANITIQVNYINGHWNVDIGGLPFYLKHYAYYPFTIKIACPIISIVFWISYIYTQRSTPSTKKQI